MEEVETKTQLCISVPQRLTSSTFGMVAEMAINRMLVLSRLSLLPDVLFRVMVD